jgi:hypothetical protein
MWNGQVKAIWTEQELNRDRWKRKGCGKMEESGNIIVMLTSGNKHEDKATFLYTLPHSIP